MKLKPSFVKPIFTLIALLQEPLTCLQTVLPLFLLQETQASTFHISLLTSLLPTMAILSFYWESIVHTILSGKKIQFSLILSTALTPWFFFFGSLFNGPWIFILAATWYTLFLRASQPARLEILKRLLPHETRNDFFAHLFRLSYIFGMVLGPIFGILCDRKILNYTSLFQITACLHLLSAFAYLALPRIIENEKASPAKIRSLLLDPWRNSMSLLRNNSVFTQFQIGFFIAGSGLMLAKPAGDILLSNLHLSYCTLFLCRTMLKGLGLIGSTKKWGQNLQSDTILFTSATVALCFCLSQLSLLGSLFFVPFVFIAYFLYGIAQGGSHLVWNLSGPLLSGDQSSCQYSSVNIVSVGIRGAIAPLIGGTLLHMIGIVPTMFSATFCITIGLLYFQHAHKKSAVLNLEKI